MSIRLFMLLMLVAIGLLFVLGFGLDWTPDISREEWAEQHGGPSREQIEAMRQFHAEQMGEMSGRRQGVMGDLAVQQDIARSAELAAADDATSAEELARLLERYAPASQHFRQAGTPQLHQQASEIITQMVIESPNSHLFDALMASQVRSGDRGYRAHVAEILAARRDPGALAAVLDIAAQMHYSRDSKHSETPVLARAIRQFSPADRLQAARAYLASSDYRDKAFAIELLGDVKTAEAAEILLEHFGRKEMGGHWQQLIAAVARIGSPAVEPLKTHLANPGSQGREWAARSLEKIDDPAVAGIMIELLADEDVMVAGVARGYFASMSYRQEFRDNRHRQQQREALRDEATQDEPPKVQRAKLVAEGEAAEPPEPPPADTEDIAMDEPPEPLPPLDAEARELTTIMLSACGHESPVVRRTAVDILARQRDPRSYGALLQACLDPDASVQRQAAIAVGAGNYNSQFEPARELAKYVKASPAGQKAMAAGGLHRMSPEQLLAVLKQAYRAESSFKPEAAAMLVRIGGAELTPLYFDMLVSPNDRISNTGRRGLWRHIRGEHVSDLRKTFASRHRHVRNNTQSLLRHLGPPHAIEPLLEMLQKDPDYRLRDGAGEILAKYDDPRLVRPLYEWIWACRMDTQHTRRWRDAEVVVTGLAEDPSWALEELTHHEDPRRQAYAAGWLIRTDRDDARSLVLQRLQQDNMMVAGAVYRHLTPEELKQFAPLLIKTMNQPGRQQENLEMANYFLNCGNERLGEAAEDWAHRNGYRIIQYWLPG
jgi:HEAT repeat protein